MKMKTQSALLLDVHSTACVRPVARVTGDKLTFTWRKKNRASLELWDESRGQLTTATRFRWYRCRIASHYQRASLDARGRAQTGRGVHHVATFGTLLHFLHGAQIDVFGTQVSETDILAFEKAGFRFLIFLRAPDRTASPLPCHGCILEKYTKSILVHFPRFGQGFENKRHKLWRGLVT